MTIDRGVVHDVIASDAPAVSIHAYSPPLTEMGYREIREMMTVGNARPVSGFKPHRSSTCRSERLVSAGSLVRPPCRQWNGTTAGGVSVGSGSCRPPTGRSRGSMPPGRPGLDAADVQARVLPAPVGLAETIMATWPGGALIVTRGE
jgi:hypothetical protein